MALIGEKNFTISQINGNGFGSASSKFNYYSQTSLLSTRVEFKSSKEHSPDESSDEEESDSLKAKYTHLKPDSANEVKSAGASGGASALQAKLAAAKSTNNNNDLLPKPANKDGNELGQPKFILYPRERINTQLDWKKPNRIGAGLSNLGNTCFLNSVLQCLTYCPPLVNYLNDTIEEHRDKCRQNFCMICLLTNHINNALQRIAPVIKPIQICQRIKSIAKHFNFGRQEDSHEFLRYVIDHLWRSCLAIHEQDLGGNAKLDHLTKSTTAINHIFGGYHRSQVSCLNCKEKSNTYDYFMDFMLEIQNVSSLQEALQKFVTPETLCHDNAYKCSKCKKSVSARKQFTVYRAPNVATFQFKRFDCTRIFGKISKPVTYPEKLNLAPYMSDKSAPIMYKLMSVLVHHGQTSNSGHYFCFVRNSNNSWYLMDDSHVSQVPLDEVLRQKAYVLFYARVPDTASHQQQQYQGYNKLAPKLNVNSPTPSVKLENNFQRNTPVPKQVFNSNFKFSNGSTERPNGGGYLNGSLNNNTAHIKSTPISATSLRLNLSPLNKSFTQLPHASPPKKPTQLVPYDSDDEKQHSEDNSVTVRSNGSSADKKQVLPQKRDQKSQSQDSRPPSSSSNSSAGTSGSGDSTLPPSSRPSSSASSSTQSQVRASEPAKEPIPILKVKATTNSWQVVEAKAPSSKVYSSEKSPKVQQSITGMKSWKISRSSHFSDSPFSEKEGASQNGGGTHEQYGEGKHNNSKSHKEHSDSEKLERAYKEKKDKKKKRKKKDKERQRRRSEDSDEEEETELSWVERTKETLEQENKSQHKSNDHPEKRKHSQLEPESSSTTSDGVKKMKHSAVDSSRKTDVLDSLLKGALPKGFDENVKSWNGESSNLNRSIAEDNKKSTVYDYDEDDYNNEFDQGKIKKTKKPMEKVDVFHRSSIKTNPFQRAGHSRYGNNNNNNHNNSNGNDSQNWFRNSFNKPPANKFNGINNKPFTKFGEGGSGGGGHHRHFDKHNGYHHPYNNNNHHHRPNSNGGYHQRKFFNKHR